MWLTGTTGEWSMYGYTSGTTDTEYLMNQNYRVRQQYYFSKINKSFSKASLKLSFIHTQSQLCQNTHG